MTKSEEAGRLLETASLTFEKMRDPSNAHKSIKDIRDEVLQEMGAEAVGKLTEFLGIACGRLVTPEYKAPEKCDARHPLTGKKCAGGRGHAGCHQVTWDPYNCKDWWVTPCNKACPTQECSFRENSGGNGRLGWEECLWCGQIRGLRVVGCAPSLRLMSDIEHGDVQTRQEWTENVEDGGFEDDDGHGVLAKEKGMDIWISDIVINPSELEGYDWPSWATHVVWYNR